MRRPAAASVVAALDEAEGRLQAAGVPDARRDAAALMALVLHTDRGGVAVRRSDPLSPPDAERFAALVASRSRRAPLQYIEGTAEFHGLVLAVAPSVLIPRPETEDLVDAVLAAGLPDDAVVADLGTGSGCIAIALAAARSRWRVLGIDASGDAIEQARANALRHGVAERISFAVADFTKPTSYEENRLDAIVSNPPYVSEDEWQGLEPEVREHEPKRALVPGPTGLEAYAAVVPLAFRTLRFGGLLALELGWKSEGGVRRLAEDAGFRDVLVRPDLCGLPRVLTAIHP